MKSNPPLLPGTHLSQNIKAGHLIRSKQEFSSNIETLNTKTLIVGAGISGLSAGYHLHESGYNDFLILELENTIGGNSSSSKNSLGVFPRGAHYSLPLNQNVPELQKYYSKFDIIEENKKFSKKFTISTPFERTKFQNKWINEFDTPLLSKAYQELYKFIESFQQIKTNDGNRPFAIPFYRSSKDPRITFLDSISLYKFLQDNSFTSSFLIKYLDYWIYDEFGCSIHEASAWAGIFFILAQTNYIKSDEEIYLSYQNSNSYHISNLSQEIRNNIKSGQLVMRIIKNAVYEAMVLDTRTTTKYRIRCENIIYCAPPFTLKRILSPNLYKNFEKVCEYETNAWLTANIIIEKKYLHEKNTPLTWTTGSLESNSTSQGYIINPETIESDNLINATIYFALSKLNITKEKAIALTELEIQEIIVNEFERIHNGRSKYIKRIDSYLIGHAMATPEIGRVQALQDYQDPESFYLAHSHNSIVSRFSEAFYLGHRAAMKVITRKST